MFTLSYICQNYVLKRVPRKWFCIKRVNIFKALGNTHTRRVTTNTLFDFVVNKYCLIPQHDSLANSKILENMIPPPESLKDPIHVPQMRLLMGPGPSNVSTRVLEAQALPTLGHLHPEFCKVRQKGVDKSCIFCSFTIVYISLSYKVIYMNFLS